MRERERQIDRQTDRGQEEKKLRDRVVGAVRERMRVGGGERERQRERKPERKADREGWRKHERGGGGTVRERDRMHYRLARFKNQRKRENIVPVKIHTNKFRQPQGPSSYSG